MDDRSRRFGHAYRAWRERRAQGKLAAKLQKTLLREYRHVWETGDEAAKLNVLLFLGRARPPDAEDIVWASLQSESPSLAGLGLALAVSYVRKYNAQPNEETISTLVDIAEKGQAGNRPLAVDVLGLAGVDGLDSWLKELAQNDSSPEVQRRANIILMRKGHRPAKLALLAGLREHPDHFGVADDLWQKRHALSLTKDEERQLREVASRYVVWLRGRLRDPDENQSTRQMAAGMLSLYARDGFPFEEEDVEAAGQFATRAREVKARVYAVEALAAFGTPQARRWLKELASGDQPAEVADHARCLLRRRRR